VMCAVLHQYRPVAANEGGGSGPAFSQSAASTAWRRPVGTQVQSGGEPGTVRLPLQDG
jgi:hypothetical protein